MGRHARFLISIMALATIMVVLSPGATAQSPQVTQLKLEGVINVFTADYISSGLDRAAHDGASAVVITMDTPGGLDTAMRRIIQSILASPLPVVVYVSPGGARAASAGLYISQAAEIVAMAPGTNIGSAHPVFFDSSGNLAATDPNSQQAIEEAKVLNDSVAYIQGLANLHHRNADWDSDAVRHSVNVTAEVAVNLHVADVVSRDLPTLLNTIDGRTVDKHGSSLTLHTAGAEVVVHEMGFVPRILHDLADPSISFFILLLAVVAIGFEVTHPGAILPGVVGVLLGIVALVSVETLPVSYAGVGLMAFAVLLFAIDTQAPSHGVLTLGGVISLLVGSYLFLDAGSPNVDVNLGLVVIPPLLIGVVMAFLVSKAAAARRRPVTTGVQSMVGTEGEARESFGPEGGMILVDGALWQAHSSQPVQSGARVKIRRVDGLHLEVDPV